MSTILRVKRPLPKYDHTRTIAMSHFKHHNNSAIKCEFFFNPAFIMTVRLIFYLDRISISPYLVSPRRFFLSSGPWDHLNDNTKGHKDPEFNRL